MHTAYIFRVHSALFYLKSHALLYLPVQRVYSNILTYIDYITEFSRRIFLFTISLKYEFQRNVRYRWVITIYILYVLTRARYIVTVCLAWHSVSLFGQLPILVLRAINAYWWQCNAAYGVQGI